MRFISYFILLIGYIALYLAFRGDALDLYYIAFIAISLLVCITLELLDKKSSKAMMYVLLFSLSVTNIIPLCFILLSNDISSLAFYWNNNFLNSAAGLVSIFIGSILLGFSAPCKSVSAQNLMHTLNYNYWGARIRSGRNLFFFLSIFCALAFVILAGDSFWQASIYTKGIDYGSSYDNAIAGNFSYLYSIFFTIYIYFVIAFASLGYMNGDGVGKIIDHIPRRDIFHILILFAFSCLYLIGGDRGPFIFCVATVFSAYTIITKKINFFLVIIALLFSASIMKLVTFIRSGYDGGINFVLKLFIDGEIFMLFDELYGTFIHIQVASDIVISEGIKFGMLWLSNILSVFPLLVRTLRNFDAMPDFSDSALYFTDIILGGYITVGLGTNLIADILINLGFFGVVVVGFFIGYSYAKINNGFSSGSYFISASYIIMNKYKTVLFLTFTAGFFYLPRAGLFNEFKSACWGSLILAVFYMAHSRFKFNKNQ